MFHVCTTWDRADANVVSPSSNACLVGVLRRMPDGGVELVSVAGNPGQIGENHKQEVLCVRSLDRVLGYGLLGAEQRATP